MVGEKVLDVPPVVSHVLHSREVIVIAIVFNVANITGFLGQIPERAAVRNGNDSILPAVKNQDGADELREDSIGVKRMSDEKSGHHELLGDIGNAGEG